MLRALIGLILVGAYLTAFAAVIRGAPMAVLLVGTAGLALIGLWRLIRFLQWWVWADIEERP